jgi:hypothetical protein
MSEFIPLRGTEPVEAVFCQVELVDTAFDKLRLTLAKGDNLTQLQYGINSLLIYWPGG